MFMITRVIIAGIILLLGGLFTFGYGFVTDPFLIPFQDYNQMPEAQQLNYQSQQETSKFFKDKGTALLIAGGSIFGASILLKLARNNRP